MARPSRILVAGASARQLVCFLRSAGYVVAAIDFFADRDTSLFSESIKVSGFDAIPAAASKLNFDRWLMAGGMENHPDVIARLNRIAPLAGPSLHDISRCRNLETIDRLLSTTPTGVTLPSTRSVTADGRSISLGRTVAEDGSRWIRKRTDSAGGLSIKPVDAPHDSPACPGFLLQELVEGLPLGATFVSDGDECKLLQTAGTIFPRHSAFQYGGSITRQTDGSTHSRIKATGEHLARELGLKGIFGIDFVISTNELFLLEVNPRITASAELMDAPPASIARWHMESCDGQIPADAMTYSDTLQSRSGCRGKKICFTGEKDSFRISPQISDRLMQLKGRNWRLADIPEGNTHIGPCRPVATIIASGYASSTLLTDLGVAEQKLLKTISGTAEVE